MRAKSVDFKNFEDAFVGGPMRRTAILWGILCPPKCNPSYKDPPEGEEEPFLEIPELLLPPPAFIYR